MISERLLSRNPVSRALFDREAPRLALACREMAERFLAGGRLYAFGRGAYATDAQHIAVEFVHPVIVGKRALPALDLGFATPRGAAALIRRGDILMGLGPPEGDPVVAELLDAVRLRGAMTFALPGDRGDYHVEPATEDPFIHQEMMEILYHTLWETVHVFFEHRQRGHDAGEAEFLYPFLGSERQEIGAAEADAANSIASKAAEDERLREEAAEHLAAPLEEAAGAIAQRLRAGGRILALGNGGSATDANDLAIDCVAPPGRLRYEPVPALSLAADPSVLSGISNDVGTEVAFVRQLIAHASPEDIVCAFSTSGSSANVTSALEEARRRGLLTIAFLGNDGGEIVRRGLADMPLIVRTDHIPRIQEIHASLYHVLRELLARVLHDRRIGHS